MFSIKYPLLVEDVPDFESQLKIGAQEPFNRYCLLVLDSLEQNKEYFENYQQFAKQTVELDDVRFYYTLSQEVNKHFHTKILRDSKFIRNNNTCV